MSEERKTTENSAENPVSETITINIQNKVAPKETHYLLIIDESGSMERVRAQTLDGLNEQIQTIKNLDAKYEDQNYFISIVKFDDEIIPLIENIPAKDVRQLTEADYVPDSWTALYDAIGISTTKLKNKIQDKLSTGEAEAFVVILTDGHENKSTEYKDNDYADPAKKIRSLITDLEKTGLWTFTFIGANQDAVLTAQALGVNVSNTVNYSDSQVGTTLAFASINSALSKRAVYRSKGIVTNDSYLSEVVASASIGEDASLLDLSGQVSDEDIAKAQSKLNDQDQNK